MTWEWVALIIVLVICATVIALFRKPQPANRDAEFKSIHKDVYLLQGRMTAMEKEYVSVGKLAEETQKLLSQANLAKGLSPRR